MGLRHVRADPIRILFNVCADLDNYNAQSLNAREIAVRLESDRFRSTFFFERTTDPRLQRPGVTLVKLPSRAKTVHIIREMLSSYDVIFYMDFSPASYFYLHLPRWVRGSTRTVLCIEGVLEGNTASLSSTVRRYFNFVLRCADIRSAVSEFVAEDTYRYCGIRPDLVVPVGVDTKTFYPSGAGNRKSPVVLFVGHLLERNGAHLFVEAAKSLPEAHFRLIGAVRDAFGENLRRECLSLNLPNLSLEVPVPQEDLARTMRDSDIFLLPSRVEGMPKVTLEAAASGLPCVLFDDYQTPSVVDSVTGFQVKTFEEMLERVKLLVHDPLLRRRMGAAAVDHARQYDWNCVTGHWAGALHDLLQTD